MFPFHNLPFPIILLPVLFLLPLPFLFLLTKNAKNHLPFSFIDKLGCTFTRGFIIFSPSLILCFLPLSPPATPLPSSSLFTFLAHFMLPPFLSSRTPPSLSVSKWKEGRRGLFIHALFSFTMLIPSDSLKLFN